MQSIILSLIEWSLQNIYGLEILPNVKIAEGVINMMVLKLVIKRACIGINSRRAWAKRYDVGYYYIIAPMAILLLQEDSKQFLV